jgi:hypothetical protein
MEWRREGCVCEIRGRRVSLAGCLPRLRANAWIHALIPTRSSIKLHIPDKKKRAIAHFYRPAVVYPYISPDLFRAPGTAQRPIEARVVKGLGWSLSGDKGMVELKARLSRSTWVAGQKVWIEVFVANACNRKVSVRGCECFAEQTR